MASAQKGIQGITGLSYVVARRNVIEASKEFPRRSYYCNLYRQYDYFERMGQMHFTPPVQAVYAARQALDEYFEEGETRKWERHLELARHIHDGLASMGLSETILSQYQSQLVVSVDYPDDERWDFDAVHDFCYERGYTIYPGKIDGADTFRLCTLGAIVPADIDDFFVVLREAFAHFGIGCR
jgi:2-aminoethylphosphonate-pyruvate transaminase